MQRSENPLALPMYTHLVSFSSPQRKHFAICGYSAYTLIRLFLLGELLYLLEILDDQPRFSLAEAEGELVVLVPFQYYELVALVFTEFDYRHQFHLRPSCGQIKRNVRRRGLARGDLPHCEIYQK